jgi:hypothetical protein
MVGKVLTGNGITRCEKGTYALVGGDELSDAERDQLLPLNRNPCSQHWLNWLDRRQHAFQGLLRQLQIVAPLHPQPEALAQAEETA